MKKTTMTILLIIFALFAALAIYFVMDRDGFWKRIAGNPDLGQTEFGTLKPAPKPNEALACPNADLVDLCALRKPDIATGIYQADVKTLNAAIADFFNHNPLTIRLDDASDLRRLRYLRRTPTMHYPDTFSVEIIELNDRRTSIAIHGKAQIGQSDLGNNLALVKAALKSISHFEAQGQSSKAS